MGGRFGRTAEISAKVLGFFNSRQCGRSAKPKLQCLTVSSFVCIFCNTLNRFLLPSNLSLAVAQLICGMALLGDV
jgi:hypothetical protein